MQNKNELKKILDNMIIIKAKYISNDEEKEIIETHINILNEMIVKNLPCNDSALKLYKTMTGVYINEQQQQ